MANGYFDFLQPLVEHQLARGEDVNSYMRAIASAFDKIPRPEQLAGGTAGYGVTSGAAGAFALDLVPELPELLAGVRVRMKMHTSSAAAPTLNVSGLGARPIRDALNNPLPAGAMLSGAVIALDYDGAVWRLQSMSAPSTIAGFGLGAVGAQVPYVTNFHDTTLGAGLYRWDGSSLNAPESPGGGSAILTYRGNGLAHWEAYRISGSAGDNDPVNWSKTTSGEPNGWGPWRRDFERGFVSGKGNWFRFRGGMQICSHQMTIIRVATTSLGVNWEFPVAFFGAPFFLGAMLPPADDGVYTSLDPGDIGNIAAKRAPDSGTAGLDASLYFRKATTGNFSVSATVTGVTVWALGRWY